MNCLNCGKDTKNKKFCSRSCAAILNNTRYPKRSPMLIKEDWCLWCGGNIGKNATKYCTRRCQQDYQYHTWLNKWKLGLENGHQSDLAPCDMLRKYLLIKYDNKCSRCGWNTKNPFIDKVILEIEHIDGDCVNNNESNVDLICPNCHSLTSTYKALNRGNGKRNLRIQNK